MSMTTTQRPVTLTREGSVFRLAFRHDPQLVAAVNVLPFANYDRTGSRTWTVAVCTQTMDALRRMHYAGHLDIDPDTLIRPGEQLTPITDAMLLRGTAKRPYRVRMAGRDDRLYHSLTAVPGSTWDKTSRTLTYPPHAAAQLCALVDRGIVSDPDRILQPADVTVLFDTTDGEFHVRGDQRAAHWFAEKFPERDVMSMWADRGLDVGFLDSFSEEMYRGEIARVGPGVDIAGLHGVLHDYQKNDLGVALERTGFAVFHSMGVGKTVIGVAFGHELLTNRRTVDRVICVVPSAVRSQWRNEIIRWTGCLPTDVAVVDGDPKKRDAAYTAVETGTAKWLIVHYQAVILQPDRQRLERLANGALLIADEAHRLKNHKTKQTEVLSKMAKTAGRRLALTGTPVENKPGEWYNVLSGFTVPGVFGSPLDFLGRYCYPGPNGGFEGSRDPDHLARRSRMLYTRRSLNEVAPHMPRLRVVTKVLEPKPAYAAALRRVHAQAAEEIRASRSAKTEVVLAQQAARTGNILNGAERAEKLAQASAGADMTATGMLKLLCCSPRLIQRSESESAQLLVDAGIIPDDDGPKLDHLRLIAREMQSNGDRLVVFSTSKKMANLVAERFDADGIRYVLYTGDQNRAQRDRAVAAFTTPATDSDPGPTVFVATDAGAEGLNLGRCCSTLVNLDLPWTPGRLAQRNGRVRRLDSTAPGFLVVNLVLAGTMEAGVMAMVEGKADLADSLFGETGGRAATTGVKGRSMFEDALADWVGEQSATKRRARATAATGDTATPAADSDTANSDGGGDARADTSADSGDGAGVSGGAGDVAGREAPAEIRYLSVADMGSPEPAVTVSERPVQPSLLDIA
jgi:superfamily II DNA or RNA helicase